MSNIKLYQQPDALSLIPQSDCEIYVALQSRIFSSIPDDEAYDIMKNHISRAYISARYEMPNGQELVIIVDETMKVFKTQFGSIREDEIPLCFSRGIRGNYGDFKGLALPALSKFAQCYLKETSRLKLLTPMEEKKEPTLLERFETAKNLALSTLQKFMDGHSIEMEGATVYRFLAKLKIIQYSDDEQVDFMNSARNEVIAKRQRDKFTALDKHVRATIEKELNDLTLLDTKIKHTAQHNGLTTYFGSLIIEEKKPIAHLTNSINRQAKRYLV